MPSTTTLKFWNFITTVIWGSGMRIPLQNSPHEVPEKRDFHHEVLR
jgi:hypothetical protein